jgi:L,D-peptidoglycan transpeptidase YkuD (ErfK/YbiS/YcfS/YnhG family)
MRHNGMGRRMVGRTRLRRCLGTSLVLTLLLLGLGWPLGAAQAAPSPASTQVVTVETASPTATTGQLRAWERSGGGWRLVAGPYSVFVGSTGVGAAHEGSATTPAGTFPLTEAFGRLPNPGTAMPYFQSGTSDWWDENSSSPTYNTHVRRTTSPGGASENLYRAGPVYDYAVNIGYNLARVPGAGSAFFLHVSNGRPTAGCVSMDRDALVGILRWLRPDAQPQIIIGVAPVWAGATQNSSAIGGSGSAYFLNDRFDGAANRVFRYGEPADEVFVGDWDGNGTDTLAVRRGNTFYLKNDTTGGVADTVFSYGDPGDAVFVGDWDGNGTDTLAVRRGNAFYLKNSTTGGAADTVFNYGDPGDTVLVGDWDGNRTATLAVRRGASYFVKNTLTTGPADYTFGYGDPGDAVLVGRWTSTRPGDSLAVRRGNVFYLKYTTESGNADVVFAYGDPTDTAFTGDWDGDGVDGIGVRRN